MPCPGNYSKQQAELFPVMATGARVGCRAMPADNSASTRRALHSLQLPRRLSSHQEKGLRRIKVLVFNIQERKNCSLAKVPSSEPGNSI